MRSNKQRHNGTIASGNPPPYISFMSKKPLHAPAAVIDASILCGAERGKTRPRGFVDWRPQTKTAVEIPREGRPVDVLHVGDHDPSGVHMPLALAEDVSAFVDELGGELVFHRLAVTPEQIRRLRLPTAPPKKGDDRAFTGLTCQAEAIAPEELARIVKAAIVARMDKDVCIRIIDEETEERRELVDLIDRGLE